MARTIKIYGASDDLFEIETDDRAGEPSEIGVDSDDRAAVKITSNGEMGGGFDGVIVVGTYAPGGVCNWVIGIAQLDEDIALPPWPMTFVTDLKKIGYSPILVIEAPDDAKIEQLLPDDEDD